MRKIQGLFSLLAAGSMVFSSTVPAIQVLAEENKSSDTTVLNDTTASGDDYIGVTDTHTNNKCVKEKQLTGMDAKVFEEVEAKLDLSSSSDMNEDGSGSETSQELVCAQSNGFSTDVTKLTEEVTQKNQNGIEETVQSPVRKTHWTAWFKNDKDEEIDKSQDKGNYHGFEQSKSAAWLNFANQLKKINNGEIPEKKQYEYPTDTPGSEKLDFWSDIPGYYDILGDPEYAGMKLETTQYFAYTIKKTTTTYKIEAVEESDHSGMPKSPSGYGGDGLSGGGYGGGGMSIGGGIPNVSNLNDENWKQGDKPKNIWRRDGLKNTIKTWAAGIGTAAGGVVKWAKSGFKDDSQIAYGSNIANFALRLSPKINSAAAGYNVVKRGDTSAQAGKYGQIGNKNGDLNISGDGNKLYGYDSEGSACRDEGYLQSGDMVSKITSCDSVEMIPGLETVKVAEATVGVGNYATEIAGFETLSLAAGNEGRVVGELSKTPFWGTVKPYYWNDGGKYYIENDSSLPYHYDLESVAGTGENTVNPYGAIVSASDKLFSIINGNSDITQIKGMSKNDYPKGQPRNCIEVNDIETCSTAKTPLTLVGLDITDGKNPQELIEAEMFVHHSDYYDSDNEDGSSSISSKNETETKPTDSDDEKEPSSNKTESDKKNEDTSVQETPPENSGNSNSSQEEVNQEESLEDKLNSTKDEFSHFEFGTFD